MGLTANKPGSSLILIVDTSAAVQQVVQQERLYPAAVLNMADLAVLYTQTPRGRLGVARLSCVANCACKAIEMDGVTKEVMDQQQWQLGEQRCADSCKV
jgi:hypothetical protein